VFIVKKTDKIVSRCIASEDMKRQYPDLDQRTEMCLAQATADMSNMAAADYMYCFQEFGFEEEVDENNLYFPQESEYVSADEVEYDPSQVEEWDIAAEKPGLWENIRKKKEREGKNYRPAKRGEKDRPSKEAWKRAQSEEGEMAVQQIEKMHRQLMELTAKMKTMPVEFEEWTADMISKSELYIQNIYDFVMSYTPEENDEEEETEGSEYQGRKVKLGKPFRTPGGPKKFSVYVKNDKGNVVKVNFGDPNMKIKKNIPERRKSFRARHNCDNPGPKWKARYWSCRAW
jgi:hypothetical protein